MIRKTALLSGVAAAFLIGAPALAQETAPDPLNQDPMTQAEQPAQPEAGETVAPGAEVRAADGAVLGVLEGAGVDAAGEQTLQVRAPDGQLREAPVAGAHLEDGALILAWTEAEFDAAPSVTDSTSNVSGNEADLQEEPKPQPETDE